MKEGILFEISGGKLVASNVLTAPAVIIKANDAKDVSLTSAWQLAQFLFNEFSNNK